MKLRVPKETPEFLEELKRSERELDDIEGEFINTVLVLEGDFPNDAEFGAAVRKALNETHDKVTAAYEKHESNVEALPHEEIEIATTVLPLG